MVLDEVLYKLLLRSELNQNVFIYFYSISKLFIDTLDLEFLNMVEIKQKL